MPKSRDRSTIPPAAKVAAAALTAAALFALGVWWGGHAANGEHVPVAAGSASAAPSPSDTVELRLDAGALTLLPEAGLELRPMPSLDLSDAPPAASATP